MDTFQTPYRHCLHYLLLAISNVTGSAILSPVVTLKELGTWRKLLSHLVDTRLKPRIFDSCPSL